MGDEATETTVEASTETVTETVETVQAVAPEIKIEPSPDLAKIMADPKVKAEIAKAVAAASQKAAATERQKAQDEAKKAADRAKMDEIQRAQAEKADAEKASAEKDAKLAEATVERDLYKTLVSGGHQLADENALDFLRFQTTKLLQNNEAASVSDAVAMVVEKHGYLVKKPAAAAEPAKAEPVKQTVAAVTPKQTQQTTVQTTEEKKEKSVMDMTPAEYRVWKRANGITL